MQSMAGFMKSRQASYLSKKKKKMVYLRARAACLKYTSREKTLLLFFFPVFH